MQLYRTIVAAFCFIAQAQASDIVITYVQHLDLVDGITGVPVPGLLGHPSITWIFDLDDFLANKTPVCFHACFYDPVLNQDAINDGVAAPTSLSFIAFFVSNFATLDVEEVDPINTFQGVQYLSIGIIPTPSCTEPCSQTLTGRYSDSINGVGSGFSAAQTTDTLSGVLVPDPEPATVLLMTGAVFAMALRRIGRSRTS